MILSTAAAAIATPRLPTAHNLAFFSHPRHCAQSLSMLDHASTGPPTHIISPPPPSHAHQAYVLLELEPVPVHCDLNTGQERDVPRSSATQRYRVLGYCTTNSAPAPSIHRCADHMECHRTRMYMLRKVPVTALSQPPGDQHPPARRTPTSQTPDKAT